MKVKEVVCALERFAPLPLQESYDNAGLQLGLTEAEVSGALLCLDVTEAVVDEAISRGCNVIVAHHPLIFRKLAHITGDSYVERAVMKALKNDVAIIAMHTNMDAAAGGVNYLIAQKIGLKNVRFFGETRLENGVEGGQGVLGELPEPMAADDFLAMIKQIFGVKMLQTNQLLQRPITTVALCGGSGAFLLCDAIKAGADAFVTGEMGYHDYFGTEQQLQIAVMGHYQSEQFTPEIFRTILQPIGVRCEMTSVMTNPIQYL